MKTILLMPGLGDIHWILLKLEGWLKMKGWEKPEVWIWDIDNRPRSIDYFDYIPWVKKGGYFKLPLEGTDKKIFDSLYMNMGSPDWVPDFHSFDALIGSNGNMRNGVPFTQILEGAPINFEYGPVGINDDFLDFVKRPYILCGFSNHGMFGGKWAKHITPEIIGGILHAIKIESGDRFDFVFTGCEWDKPYADKIANKQEYINVCGKTSLHQFLSLIKNASGYMGFCGGNSIMAQHLGIPTVEWWSKTYFPQHDRKGWETYPERGNHLVLEVENYKVGGESRKQIVNFLKGAIK